MDGTVALKDLHVELLGEVNRFPISICRIVLTSCISVITWLLFMLFITTCQSSIQRELLRSEMHAFSHQDAWNIIICHTIKVSAERSCWGSFRSLPSVLLGPGRAATLKCQSVKVPL